MWNKLTGYGEKAMRKRKIRYLSLTAAIMLAAVCVLGSCGQEGKDTAMQSGVEEAVPDDQEQTISIENQTSAASPKKEETVNVSADATGNPTEISVEATLEKTSDSDLILDASNLSDVDNKRGDEMCAFVKNADAGSETVPLYWQNAGEEITYEGTSDKTLPVQVKISYYLDGNAITPDALAGKSGQVRICFDYKNQETKEVVVDDQKISATVPFSVISMMSVSKDHFKNVEVENGKIMTIGDQDMVIGYAFPGLKSSLKLKDLEATEDIEIPDHVEITADVTDFSLDYTAHIVSNGLLADADLDELDDAKDMADGMEKLMDASGELVDGMQALSDGNHTYAGYLEQYTDGVASLDSGLKELSKGTQEMDSSLDAAAKQLKTKLDEWEVAVEEMQAAFAGSDMTGLESQMMQNAGSLQQSLQAASQALSEIDWETYDTSSVEEQAKDAAVSAAESAIDAMQSDDLGLTEEQTTAVKEKVENAVVERIRNAELEVSSPDNSAAIAQTEQALQNLSDAADSFSKLQTTLSALQGMMPDNGEENAGANMLTEIDTEELRTMIDQFCAGMHELSTGAGQIEEGANALAKSGAELKDGYGQIIDGGDALLSGMKAFDKDGIGKLSDLAGDDLTNVIRRLQAVQKADQAYTNFSGLAEGTEGSVRFIIETEKIKAE